MKARLRGRTRRPPDLTSLFDVLFIVVFVALIRAADSEQKLAEAKKPPPPKPVLPQPAGPPPDIAVLQKRALADLQADLAARSPVVIRISAKNRIEAIEGDGKVHALDTPLLEESGNPSIRLQYLGHRSADLRLCALAALRLGVTDLKKHVVIIAPALPREERLSSLNEGILIDVDRCLREQRGEAVIVEPVPAEPKP